MSFLLDPSIRIRHESHFGDRVVRCFAERAKSLWNLFAATVQRAPDAEALVDGESRWTYAQLIGRQAVSPPGCIATAFSRVIA